MAAYFAPETALAYLRSGPRGTGGTDRTAEQFCALADLAGRFAGRLPAGVAEAEMRQVDAAGAENLWFARPRALGVADAWRRLRR